jgi:Domain of unknown function (DUF4159)
MSHVQSAHCSYFEFPWAVAPLRLCGVSLAVVLTWLLFDANSAGAEVTAEQVNAAITRGAAFLEKLQRPDGGWIEYDSQPGGVTALCTLALLNCGRNAKEHESVRKALLYLEKQPDPDRTYNASLMIMAFAQADAKKYAPTIKKLALALAARQMRDDRTKGGWSYKGPNDGNADNSNTQFAILALHEAERAGAKISDQTWQLALNYWQQLGMQNGTGGFGYGLNQQNATGSMTCAGIASLIIIRDRLQPGDASVHNGHLQCCGKQPDASPVEDAIRWLGNSFSVERNPNREGSLLYYLYALERVGRISGQRYFVTHKPPGRPVAFETPALHDWYREGCEFLLGFQDKLSGGWIGTGQMGENRPDVGTSFALLFLSKGRRPVVIAKLQHQPDVRMGSQDWDHHRRAVQNLTMRAEKKWQRDLSWQTIDFTPRGPRDSLQVTAADLLEAPVLFLSGSQALDFNGEQRQVLKQYLENGGFLFAEACDGNGCNGTEFDRSFRALMRDLFPDSELRKLPPDHAVWYAQEKVDAAQLPKDSEFWLWGLDACCRTSVVYCPRSLSCYWELAHPYREPGYPKEVKDEIEQVARIGSNVLAYATNRELKEKLDRPAFVVTNAGGRSPRGALVVPKLSHSGGADDAPAAINNLLVVMERQLQMRVDLEKRLIAPTDPKLLDYPIVFIHGRRAFRFSAAERKALKEYLDNGGFLFADAICANPEFASSLREEMKAIYPEAQFTRIPPSHPMFTDEFHGFTLSSVELRDPQIRAENDPLTAKLVRTTPLLEGLDVDGRIAVILSPYDISCALEKGASLDCKGYVTADAARIGANVLLFALRQQ